MAVAVILSLAIAFSALLWPTTSDLNPVSPEIRRDVLTEIGSTYEPEESAFHLRLDDVVSPYRLTSVFVMPGESVRIAVSRLNPSASYSIEALSGRVDTTAAGGWTWHAPDSAGIYPLHVDERPTAASVTINVFVMVPYDLDDERLFGYRIGQYARTLHHGDSAYLPPRGFVEVTRDNVHVLVSPHFMLGQFVSKQASGYPKFLRLREKLLLKLELILGELNERGIHAPTLHVMSAFRTPFYNKLIGNNTTYSRHLYGGAADVFVDVDDDGYMDDLNGDGEVTREDAEFLADIVENWAGEPWFEPLIEVSVSTDQRRIEDLSSTST
jgi:hypothetical protein